MLAAVAGGDRPVELGSHELRQLGGDSRVGRAIALVQVDEPVPDAVLKAVRGLKQVVRAERLVF